MTFPPPKVRLSAFLDECTRPRSSDGTHVIAPPADQLAVGQALGLTDWVPRWLNFGTLQQPAIINVGRLTDAQLGEVTDAQRQYGFTARCLGSGIGKGVKLVDVADGTDRAYLEPAQYYDEVVLPAVAIAEKLGVRSVRLFSFHHPRGTDSRDHVGPAADRLAPIVELLRARNLLPLLEIEANLVGDRAETCQAIVERLKDRDGNPTLWLIWDQGNVVAQGLDPFAQWQTMESSVVELHAKYYGGPRPKGFGPVDEDALQHFVAADFGSGAARSEPVLADLCDGFDRFSDRIFRAYTKLCRFEVIPTMVLEPHLLGGGTFGGISGAMGMGVAFRSLCRVLDYLGFTYDLHDHDAVIRARHALSSKLTN